MSGNIKSAITGTLNQFEDLDIWDGAPIEIPFFDNAKLPVTFYNFDPLQDPAAIKRGDEALANFLKLTNDDRLAISHFACVNLDDFITDVGEGAIDEEMLTLKDPKDIWKYIEPTEINIKNVTFKEPDVYISIACECDWNLEDGIQFVYRQGNKLTRVSGQDGSVFD